MDLLQEIGDPRGHKLSPPLLTVSYHSSDSGRTDCLVRAAFEHVHRISLRLEPPDLFLIPGFSYRGRTDAAHWYEIGKLIWSLDWKWADEVPLMCVTLAEHAMPHLRAFPEGEGV